MDTKEQLANFVKSSPEETGPETGKSGGPETGQPKKENTTELTLKKPTIDLSNLHTGSLALAFIVLILSLWFLVPTASGKTRMELLWLTLFGETKLVTDTGMNGSTSVTGSGPETVVHSNIIPLDFSSMDMGF